MAGSVGIKPSEGVLLDGQAMMQANTQRNQPVSKDTCAALLESALLLDLETSQKGVFARPPRLAGLRKTVVEELPFGIRQVMSVTHPQFLREPPPRFQLFSRGSAVIKQALRLKQPSVPVVVVAGFEQASREFGCKKSTSDFQLIGSLLSPRIRLKVPKFKLSATNGFRIRRRNYLTSW